jgi:diguanylate cyclase (GGDEF)-like protein
MAVNFLSIIEKQHKLLKIFVEIVLIGTIGVIDLLSGFELAFSLFYVIPISLATLYIDRWQGIMASLASALVWLWADMSSGQFYSHPLVPIWNTSIRLSFFVLITMLLSALKRAMDHEKELARTDHLTGALNSRAFTDLAQMEIDRLQRYQHTFTLAYIDLDNFKTVNDRFGHSVGDRVLCAVVSHAQRHLRKIDSIARLGGDEFGVFLPETSQESARVVLGKLHDGLLEEMKQNKWPITFSVGALTCTVPPPSVDELVNIADKLMYTVKEGGKNAIKYGSYEG